MNKNIKIILSILGVVIFGLIIILLTFNMNKDDKKNEFQKEIISNTFEIKYLENKNLKLVSNKPQNDREVLSNSAKKITITNLRDTASIYKLSLDLNEFEEYLKYIKIAYRKNNGFYSEPEYLSNLGNNYILLDNQLLEGNTSDTYEFLIWLSESENNININEDVVIPLIISKIELTQEEAKDRIPPEIILNGDLEINLDKESVFNDPGIKSVTDDTDKEINKDRVIIRYEYFNNSNKISVNNIDTSKVGTYYIYYTVMDSANNEATVIRIVNVIEKNLPIVPPVEKPTIPDTQEKPSDSEKPGEPEEPNTPEENEKPQEFEKLKLSVTYSTIKQTNKDVVVQIKSNLSLKKISGWILSSDAKTLEKSFSTNLKTQLVVISLDGQSKILEINIQNIDKTESTAPTPEIPSSPPKEEPDEPDTPEVPDIPSEPDEPNNPEVPEVPKEPIEEDIVVNANIKLVKASYVIIEALVSDSSKVKEYYFACVQKITRANARLLQVRST